MYPPRMSPRREPIPTWYFALAVVRRGDRFLMVHERKHGQLWYIPAGRVEPGESIPSGAQRETLEEAGIPIVIDGVLRVEYSPRPGGWARCRVFFLAHPADERPPKSVADKHSLEARWVHLDELHEYPLRGSEVADMLRYVARGCPLLPLSAFTYEGEPWG